MKKTGIVAQNILLPENVDMTSWACIACDQFTSELKYWQDLQASLQGKRTTLDLILPEIYLNNNPDERIEKINENISEYLDSGVFKTLDKGFILTVRSTPYVKRRIGLVGAVDLEEYEFTAGKKSLIRSTEGTITERIPPRLKIRENAKVEFPHIMVLFDDEKREICEQLYENRDKLEKVYDFELNAGGGHITGYFVEDYKSVLNKFEELLDEQRLIAKYGVNDKICFAVGDGNHSLATAKTHWDNVKKGLSDQERQSHPARYALAEFVNIYDEGVYFEPIFRLVKGVDGDEFKRELLSKEYSNIGIYTDGKRIDAKGTLSLPEGIKSVDAFIKEYISKNGGEVDYIHGEKNLIDLVDEANDRVGIFFDKLKKEDLFKYVVTKGAFPRKTFSMGEGVEKRYYLEGRKIRND